MNLMERKEELVEVVRERGPISAMKLKVEMWRRLWSSSEFSSAFNAAVESGDIRLDADMKFVAI